MQNGRIMEDERNDAKLFDQGWEFQGELVEPIPGPASFQEYLHVLDEMTDKLTHIQLQNDLVEHVWTHFGNQ